MHRASARAFPAMIIFSLLIAARAGQVSWWLVTMAALLMLRQAAASRAPDLLPRLGRAAARAEIDRALAGEWLASLRQARVPREESLAERVHRLAVAELDAYELALPSLPAWDWSS